jgi:hypothetical protein
MSGVASNITRLADESLAPTAADVLFSIAKHLDLFMSTDGHAYASAVRNGSRETWLITGKIFKNWLTREFFNVQGKAVPAQRLRDVIHTLESRAMAAPRRPVCIRVAAQDNHLYLDLNDDMHRIVTVSAAGWHIGVEAPIHFLRSLRSGALPCPEPRGNIDRLRDLINIGSDDDWHLLIGWLLGTFRPIGPYPLLVLQGEQGSAKSTLAKILKSLIDPSSAPIRAVPRDERDLLIAATHSHVLAFDNVSGLTPMFSDALCRLATSGALATRALYTDMDETLLIAQRPVVINGIEDLATRHDLLDRAILLQLPPIPDTARRTERQIWQEMELIRPAVLGALLTAVHHALVHYQDVQLSSIPRMADFATWVTAAEPALGWREGTFLAIYNRNRSEATQLGLESSLIGEGIRSIVNRDGAWEGTATELLERLSQELPEGQKNSRALPATPSGLSNHLKRLVTALRAIGINVTNNRQATRRVIRMAKDEQSAVTAVMPVMDDAGCEQRNDEADGDDGQRRPLDA